MSLFKYELYKVITKKLFWWTLIAALLVNVLTLIWFNQPNEYQLSNPHVKQVYDSLRPLDIEGKIIWLDNYVNELHEFHKETPLREELTENIKNNLTVNTYDVYLDRIDANSDALLGTAIFGNNIDSFSSKNISKTQTDFKDMRDIEIRYDVNKGVSVLFDSPSSDLIIIILIVTVCLALITDEKDRKLFLIVKSTPSGYTQTIVAKLVAMTVCVISVSLLVFLTGIVFAEATYGLGDTQRSIQSVSHFMGATLNISVLGFMGLFFVSKTIGLICIGVAVLLIAIHAHHSITLMITVILAITINILLANIPVTSEFNILRFLNFYSLLNPHRIFGDYFNLNIFGNPINLIPIYVVFVTLLLITLLSVTYFSFIKKRGLESYLNLFKLKKLNVIPSLYRTNYKYFEFKKHTFTNKAALIIVMFALIQGYSVYNAQAPFLGYEHNYIKTTLLSLQGELTDEKEHLILAQKEIYDNSVAEIDRLHRQMRDGKISMAEMSELRTPHDEIINSMHGFLKIYERYEYICETPKAQFLYDSGYARLFGTDNPDSGLMSGLFLISTMILCLCAVFSMEYKTGMYKVLNSTMHGYKETIKIKLILSIGTTIICFLIAFLPDVIYVGRFFGFKGLNFPLSSVYGISNIYIPVWSYIIILTLLRLMVFIGVSLVILALSLKTRNNVYTALCAFGVLLIPLLIHTYGINQFDLASLLSLITMNKIITSFEFLNVLQIIGFIFICATCIKYIFKNFGKA